MNMQFKASARCLQQVLHRSGARARFRLLRAPVTADGHDDGPAQAGSLEALVREFLEAEDTGPLSAEAEAEVAAMLASFEAEAADIDASARRG